MSTVRPQPGEYAPYHEKYVGLVLEEAIVPAFERQRVDLTSFLRGISEAAARVLHPPYTWSTNQVVGHMLDAERVFGYRALRFARNDQTPLPGFEENEYVKQANFDAVPLARLTEEWDHLRRSHILFFQALVPEIWVRSGVANEHRISLRATAYIMVGHVRHHLNILRQRHA